MSVDPIQLSAIATTISSFRYRYADEDQLQETLAGVLTSAGYEVEREVRLDAASRIDLLIGKIGIEVKVAGQAAAVRRQLVRYATRPEIDALILVTTRARHHVPAMLSGKPVAVVCLTEAGL